ncbi:isopentenyl-diphosphate Delta-isomerase [Dyadobacter frigoris]|uniref:isopentenyl-diphosphate Delta-isomerase n=1 Tax=Dyadobacter frigoris TaxID=2576211 RepID=UPI0024A60407|nr:isopentenyl-diphosphate Delta-isomerase [Dyadobacter frigoris]GLU54178.1 isopentenyl-diphosphate Delta-isomerase [Dyadobacter frigoris]
MDKIILIDKDDNEIGVMEKIETHRLGLLHRAFSIFLFNENGEMLLQQRALSKYHSAGLWSNACCGHPRPNELTKQAAIRRLGEELGFETNINKVFHFCYHASLDNGLIENEFDHVFIGKYDGIINPNIDEVHSWKYDSLENIKRDIMSVETSNLYTVWFKIAFTELLEHLKNDDIISVSKK